MIWDDRTPEKRRCQPLGGPQRKPTISDYTDLTKFSHKLIILSFYNIIYFRNVISCEVALQQLYRKKHYTNNLEFNWIYAYIYIYYNISVYIYLLYTNLFKKKYLLFYFFFYFLRSVKMLAENNNFLLWYHMFICFYISCLFTWQIREWIIQAFCASKCIVCWAVYVLRDKYWHY